MSKIELKNLTSNHTVVLENIRGQRYVYTENCLLYFDKNLKNLCHHTLDICNIYILLNKNLIKVN